MLGPIFQCYACDTIFTQSNTRYFLGQAIEVCPNKFCCAESNDWDHLPNDEFYTTFYGLIGASFDEARRTNLREIAEMAMGPFNPLSRLL